MRHFIFTLLIIIVSLALQGQSVAAPEAGFSVSGQLIGDNEPVAYANVLLLQALDSSLVQAQLSDEAGNFSITADSGLYLLQVVMLGFSDYQSEAFQLSPKQAAIQLGTLQLEAFAETLATAVVTSKKPLLEQQAGKMIVNVEGSITGQTGSATQLLQKVPGLIVRQGNVTMAGSPSVTILIDGKPTRYMDVNSLLKDLPAADISKIEVISQPGAIYDAEGGGVINIVLKKNVRLGTNGSVRMGIGRGTYDKFNTSIQVGHRDGPLNTHGSVSYRRGSGFDQLLLDREVNGTRIVQNNIEPSLPNTMSLRGGVDYDLNSRHGVGINARYSTTNDDAVGTNTTAGYDGLTFNDELRPAAKTFDLLTANENYQDRVNYGADAFYRFKIDTSGQQLDVDISYASFDREGDLRTTTQVLFGDLGTPINDIKNRELGATEVAAAQIDYTKPLTIGSAPKLLLRTGSKFSSADIDADLQATSRPMASEIDFINAPGLTNRFLYNEQIAAGYASVDMSIGEVKLNAGIRYEHTFIDGENVTSDSSFVRDYGGFFPSFGVSLPIKGKVGLSGAYSYRIDRPNYQSLNPFIRFIDPITVQRGNTQLQPSYIHNGQMSLTYEGQPFFRLAYTRTSDAISMVTAQNSQTKITEGYQANLDQYTSYGGHLFAPLSFIPKVDGYIGGMAYYNEYESQFLGAQFKQGSWAFTGFANATIDLPIELKAELNYWIQSGGQEGILQNGTIYGSSIGIERKFLEDQLTVGLSYEDGLFNPYDGKIRYQDQQYNIINTWETDIVMLNLTYKFGNRYLKGKDRRNSAAQDLLNRAENN